MAELRIRLTELCEESGVGVELVAGTETADQVLDRTLAECERVLASPASGSDLARLRSLVGFARRTRELQRAIGGPGLEDEQQELERLGAEVERLQQQLAETLEAMEHGSAERLEELFAELSRLCHKINNPLTAVMGRAQMLQLRLAQSGDEKTCSTVRVIEESAQRVAAYVQELALVCNRGRAEFTGS